MYPFLADDQLPNFIPWRYRLNSFAFCLRRAPQRHTANVEQERSQKKTAPHSRNGVAPAVRSLHERRICIGMLHRPGKRTPGRRLLSQHGSMTKLRRG
jgi:hypothetical protein